MESIFKNSFNKLLAFLSGDLEQAAREYELTREKLIVFFRDKGLLFPEEAADITLDRVGLLLTEEREITRLNPHMYIFSVAQNVLLELLPRTELMKSRRMKLRLDTGDAINPLEQNEQEEKQREHDLYLDLFEECLRELSSRDRQIIITYYTTKGLARREMAERFGIPYNLFIIEAHRIRRDLEDRIKARLGKKLMSEAELTDVDISVLTPQLESAMQTLAVNQKQIKRARLETETLKKETQTIIFRILANTGA
jgi:DNA-directed RNA polymerase specialized sigma24 family protein